jgi:hypothetical protein
VSAEAHEECEDPKITIINQIHIAISYHGRKAVVQLANQIMGRLIVASHIWRLGNLMAIGIQRPSFQLGKEERA